MLGQIKKILNNATWFLRTGVVPSNAKYEKNLSDLNHMTSKKFAMTMIAVAVVAFMYFASILFLFFFDGDPHVSALVSMYKDMIVAIATIVGTLVGIQGLVDWKHNSSTSIEQKSESNISKNYVEEYLSGPKEDDYILDIEFVSRKK